MSPNGFFGRLDQIARQFLADLVRTVINDPRKLLHRDAAERCRSGIARQNRGCELALERIGYLENGRNTTTPHPLYSSAARVADIAKRAICEGRLPLQLPSVNYADLARLWRRRVCVHPVCT